MAKIFKWNPNQTATGTGVSVATVEDIATGIVEGVGMGCERISVKTAIGRDGILYSTLTKEPAMTLKDGVLVASLEGESTNHVQYSYDFTNPYWVKRGGSSAIQNLISPRGINEACSITFAMSSSDDIYRTNILSSGSNNIALSMWIKNTTNSLKKIKINNAQSPSSGDWRVDLSMIPNEWTRIDKNHESVTVVIPMADTSGFGVQFQSLIASEFVTIGVWGVQAEVSENTSSYIPTNGSTQTRGADVGFKTPDISSLINLNSGVLEVEMALYSLPTTDQRISIFDENDTTNRIVLIWDSSSNLNVFYFVDDVATYSLAYNYDATTTHVLNYSFKEGEHIVMIGGVQVGVTGTGSVGTSNKGIVSFADRSDTLDLEANVNYLKFTSND